MFFEKEVEIGEARRTSIEIVAENLRRFRKERGLTLLALSAKSGVGIRKLSNMENGKGKFSTGTIDKLCDALKLSPAEFFAESKGD